MRARQGASLSTAYPDSVRFLYALGNEFRTLKLGLERIKDLLEAIGNPHKSCRQVHVAGTNGKGSTCALIESGLRQAGWKTGLYTSPHLLEPTERVKIGGVPVTPAEFSAAFDVVHRAANEAVAAGTMDGHPSYFETITAMAFWLFREHAVEVGVLETGMGGRLDATNVVTPELSVITPVDFDHERFLGDTIPEIAYEKAGIIKPGVPVMLSRQREDALEVLVSRAKELQSPVHQAAEWAVEDLSIDAEGSRFRVRGPDAMTLDLECPLVGAHQVENTVTAVGALHELGVPVSDIEAGVRAARWPGRLELVARRPDIYLDGAHNPAGARALAEYIRTFHPGRHVVIVFAAMRDKDINLIGSLLFPLAAELIFTTVQQSRAYTAEDIQSLTGEMRAKLTQTAAEAVAMVRQAPREAVVFITGSLYLVGEVRGWLVDPQSNG